MCLSFAFWLLALAPEVMTVMVVAFFVYIKNEIVMKILVNNKVTETGAGSVAELAEELGLPENGVAVAVGGVMVKRCEWGECVLSEGDSVIVIKAACGG